MKINILKKTGYIALLTLAFGMGCSGDSHNSNVSMAGNARVYENSSKNSLVLDLEFAKDDHTSLEKALEIGSNIISEKYEPKLNQILSAMRLGVELENSKLTAKDPAAWVTNLIGIEPKDKDLKYYQEVFLESTKNIKVAGRSIRLVGAIFHTKLVWPGLSQEQEHALSDRHKDLTFPQAAKQHWKIEIPYRTLLATIFNSIGREKFARKEKFGDQSGYELDKIFLSPTRCKEMKEKLSSFIKTNFSDLGEVENLDCAKKFFVDSKFTLAGRHIEFNNNFPALIQELLLIRYDNMFSNP